MYVGKNNYQNEEVTFKIATGNDWWFHAKGIPGSHVIVKSEGKELPDRVFEEAGALAAYYSKGIHLAFVTDEYETLYKKHKEMGVICFENPSMGIYFISDPDGYWIEIIPTR